MQYEYQREEEQQQMIHKLKKQVRNLQTEAVQQDNTWKSAIDTEFKW